MLLLLPLHTAQHRHAVCDECAHHNEPSWPMLVHHVMPSFITALLQQFLWCSIVERLKHLVYIVFPVIVC